MPTIEVARTHPENAYKESIPKVALRWMPHGRRKPGRLKTTLWKTANT